jgi:hypothetical protein
MRKMGRRGGETTAREGVALEAASDQKKIQGWK